MAKRISELKKLFLQSENLESEKIELDNFDKAKLVRNGNLIEVENENGTRFPLTDLSEDEIDVFIYVLEH